MEQKILIVDQTDQPLIQKRYHKDYKYITFLWMSLFNFVTASVILSGFILSEYSLTLHIILCCTVIGTALFVYLTSRDKTYVYHSAGFFAMMVFTFATVIGIAFMFSPEDRSGTKGSDSQIRVISFVFFVMDFISVLYTYFRRRESV